MKQTHLVSTGMQGEATAAAYLQSLGYTVCAHNVRIARDEIDIIAHDPADNVFVFTEVKSRSRFHADYRPELNLTPRKRAAMARAAREWMRKQGYECGYRMDLVCVAEGVVVDHWKEIAWD